MTDKTSWLQQWLENIWYKNAKGRFLLLPLSALYCSINRYQRNKYSQNQPKIPCPIIVVGNISVGGTGKTPLTLFLTKLLQKEGFKPAIITRGYGGKATQWPQSVSPDTDPELVGDEAVLMATRSGVPVFAGANRLQSIKLLMETHDCDVIVSDDGLQHYKMPRDIQIAVVDATRLFGNGYCLPAGPLREKKERLDDCDFVIQNGGKEPVNKSWIRMQLEGNTLINLKTGEKRSLDEFSGKTVNAVTGIGNPQRFFKSLEQGGLSLQTHSFPDHHSFQELDLSFNDNFPILMTEKDAVKCKKFSTKNQWYLPITASLNEKFNRDFLELLKQKV